MPRKALSCPQLHPIREKAGCKHNSENVRFRTGVSLSFVAHSRPALISAFLLLVSGYHRNRDLAAPRDSHFAKRRSRGLDWPVHSGVAEGQGEVTAVEATRAAEQTGGPLENVCKTAIANDGLRPPSFYLSTWAFRKRPSTIWRMALDFFQACCNCTIPALPPRHGTSGDRTRECIVFGGAKDQRMKSFRRLRSNSSNCYSLLPNNALPPSRVWTSRNLEM